MFLTLDGKSFDSRCTYYIGDKPITSDKDLVSLTHGGSLFIRRQNGDIECVRLSKVATVAGYKPTYQDILRMLQNKTVCIIPDSVLQDDKIMSKLIYNGELLYSIMYQYHIFIPFQSPDEI